LKPGIIPFPTAIGLLPLWGIDYFVSTVQKLLPSQFNFLVGYSILNHSIISLQTKPSQFNFLVGYSMLNPGNILFPAATDLLPLRGIDFSLFTASEYFPIGYYLLVIPY